MKIKDSLIDDCNHAAALEVQNFWLLRGYSQAQVDLWDRRVEFNIDLAMFWVFTKASIPFSYEQSTVNYLDRRKDLNDNLVFSIGGEIVPPGNTGQDNAAGTIGYGRVGEAFISTLKTW